MRWLLSGLQWMLFMIAGAIAAPIAIADLFQLSPVETAGFMQRTIFILGLAGILQGLFGHKLPIHEGPAGLWWGIFTIYASLVSILYSSNTIALQTLSGGMIISGVFFILLALLKLIDKIARLFTPTITFVYLFLLIFQLSGSFMKGMLGITAENIEIKPMILFLSVIVVCITFWLGKNKQMLLQRYSIMISIVIGWLLFLLFQQADPIQKADRLFQLPKLLPFGPPLFDMGTIITSALLTLLLLTNAIVSIRLMAAIVHYKNDPNRYLRASFVSGINHFFSGLFGAIGSVPISGAAGFVEQTGIKKRLPFLIGCFFVIAVSLFPLVMNLIAAIPAPIGYAVTFVIFVSMFGLALKELSSVQHVERAYIVAGVSLLIGIGLMFIPAEATKSLSPALEVLVNNGLVCGSVIAIILEQAFIAKEKLDQKNSKNH
ncbi:purine/pyrimidine permease [Bacillus sp. FJAT-50079]|uniref:purine/pyrimidine permease n=1 Tax=Bacillus sp. FJAT-50079 TaxID=2833577 RepID=UPI001BC94B01|nr:purine/pyrimidine permease [Bacillus sp. FJAT-50079]MBS4207483.1 purine/pyrimidine permease [Bacillus sp. FJAT-50079]